MGLLSKLKSLLGMESTDSGRGGRVDVTVEREADSESEEAVEEPAAEPTDAGASTESLVEDDVEAGEKDSPAERAEPGEVGAGQPSEEEETTDVEAVEPGEEEEPSAPDREGAEDVEVIKGVGPAYADRLEDAGYGTVAELAEADAEELAEEIDLSPKRVQRWIDRARDRLDAGDED